LPQQILQRELQRMAREEAEDERERDQRAGG